MIMMAFPVGSLGQILLILKVNRLIGISDSNGAIIAISLYKFTFRLLGLPLLIMMTKLSPKTIEGTMFGVCLSCVNFGENLSYLLSS